MNARVAWDAPQIVMGREGPWETKPCYVCEVCKKFVRSEEDIRKSLVFSKTDAEIIRNHLTIDLALYKEDALNEKAYLVETADAVTCTLEPGDLVSHEEQKRLDKAERRKEEKELQRSLKAKADAREARIEAKSKINPLFEIVDQKIVDQKTGEIVPDGVVVPDVPELPKPKLSGYQPKICPFCNGEVPSNGAAQFSHLKKHVNELVSKLALTAEQAATIRSVKLTPEMQKVFDEFYAITAK